MRVLVACEFSNTVRDAFLKRGHDAYSCDLRHAGCPNPNFRRHIRGDVRPLLREQWDLVIAHPPCTYLCQAGAANFTKYGEEYRMRRLRLLNDAIGFFLACINANAPRVAVENPRMSGTARKAMLIPSSQVIQPYEYGHPFKKETHLWLVGLPLLRPTNIVIPIGSAVSAGRNKQDRCKVYLDKMVGNRGSDQRSITFQGIANAMAEQWG